MQNGHCPPSQPHVALEILPDESGWAVHRFEANVILLLNGIKKLVSDYNFLLVLILKKNASQIFLNQWRGLIIAWFPNITFALPEIHICVHPLGTLSYHLLDQPFGIHLSVNAWRGKSVERTI